MTANRTPDVVSGEADIIALLKPLAAPLAGSLGLADDCAELTPLPGHDLVLKCDPVRAGVHFLADDDPADIAWKALAVNVSDLAAKGARPVAYLLALSLPEAPQRAWLQRFVAGLGAAQSAFAITLIGGDTDRAPGPLSIAVTVVGEVPRGRMVRRAAAEIGDDLFVSGTLGDAAVGLKLRTDLGLADRLGLAVPDREILVARYLRPSPRLGLKAALRNHARAAMDLSDGLAKDLGRMMVASGAARAVQMSAIVEAERLPLSPAFRAALAAGGAGIEAALSHGDDYEVLAAVPPASAADFMASATAGGVSVAKIGCVVRGRGVRIMDAVGKEVQLQHVGYDHF